MQPTVLSTETRALARLRREWGAFLLLALAMLAAGAWALLGEWGVLPTALWAASAAAVLAYHFGTLWAHLGENRLKDPPGAPLFDDLGLANGITIFRAILVAGLVGFLFAPWPSGWLAWVPSALFLADALMDFFDGAVARWTGRATVLGERLDMQWDSVGVLVASILAVLYGQAAAPYALIGLARYLYLFGLWLHRRRGGETRDLPASRFRRAMAGMQMGFIAVVLMPVYSPPATQIASLLFMTPTAAGFIRDYLAVTGAITPRPKAPRAGSWLPLALRGLLAALLVEYLLWQVGQGAGLAGGMLVAALAVPALALGITGRLAALAVLLMAGFGLRADLLEARYWALLFLSVLLFMTGTGRYSLWTPEEWLIDHRAGEARG
jgi:CDP-diacylglycerol--glycerol-3-phosphate 3-phosphatidyltransferase